MTTTIKTESDATAMWVRVVAYDLPEGFDPDENEDDYEALNDALGPWGGYTSAVDVERVPAENTIHVRFERDH